MQDVLHFVVDFGVGGQHVESEQVFFEVQVEVALEVTETDRVPEHIVLNLLDVGLALYQNEPVEVVYDVVQFLPHDLLHVDLDLGLEVVQTVEEGPDVSLQGPASVRKSQPLQQLLERVSLL